jgi:hypothetical protein
MHTLTTTAMERQMYFTTLSIFDALKWIKDKAKLFEI